LYKHYFKKPVALYFARYFINIAVTVAAAAATWFICSLLPSGLWWLVLRFGICAVVPNVIFLACFCWTRDFKMLFNKS
jgi:hypothetical protein